MGQLKAGVATARPTIFITIPKVPYVDEGLHGPPFSSARQEGSSVFLISYSACDTTRATHGSIVDPIF